MKMKNIYLALAILLYGTSLYSYSDIDFDGVEDALDQCKNTPLTDLVDEKGCTIKSLVSPHHFNILLGFRENKVNSKYNKNYTTKSKTLEIDYFYKNFTLKLSTAYYNTTSSNYSKSGNEDSYLYFKYKNNITNTLSLTTSVGIMFPTYNNNLNNNNTDYSLSTTLSYNINKLLLFSSYNYTFINDDDIDSLEIYYQNTNAYTVGLSYKLTSNLSGSISYSNSLSSYKNSKNLLNHNISLFYIFDNHWFSNISYTRDLDRSIKDDTTSLKIGYYF